MYAENARRQKRKKHEVDYTGSGHASPSPTHHDGDVHDETMTSAERAYEEAGLEMIPGRGEGSKNNNNNNKRAKGNNHKERKPKPISSVFVTGLPLDTDIEEMGEFFKKGGVFMEDDGGKSALFNNIKQEMRYWDGFTDIFFALIFVIS